MVTYVSIYIIYMSICNVAAMRNSSDNGGQLSSQANHAFLFLTADTCGKLSDDFVCFLCFCMYARVLTTSVLFFWCSLMLFVHLYTFPCLSRVCSAHTVHLCYFSYTAPFDTLYLLAIAFAF
jgi:hypothetical protein